MKERQTSTNRKSVKKANKLGRLLLILFVFAGIFGGLFLRVGYIKTVHGEEYSQKVKQHRVAQSDSVISAMRGSILDRNGNVLAESTRVYNVILDSKIIREAGEEKMNATVEALSTILEIEEEAVTQYLTEEYANSRYKRLPEGRKISAAVKEKLEKAISDGKAVGYWFEDEEQRSYPNNSLAAHVLGFNGNYGVEQVYNEYMVGTPGRQMVVSSEDGSYVEEYIAAQDGANLTLTLDETIQYYMEETLLETMLELNCLHASAVAMNPKTGEILGLVNYPSFNLNNSQEVIGITDKYTSYYPDPTAEEYYQEIWKNFAVNDGYQPGSTYKPIFASMALEEASIGTGTSFVCNGSMSFYDRTIHCAYSKVHGVETIREIIKNSCNVGMTQISEKLGKTAYLKYQDAFGIGQYTGIDLIGEAAGIIYTEDTMGPVELATTSYGQGFNVTPIQLITAFSAVINGGELLQPYVVKQVTDPSGNLILQNDKTVVRYPISKETSSKMKEYLKDVVEDGSGEAAAIAGYEIGGKTGTAQKGVYEEKKYIASFIGFAPVDDPEIVLLVILDESDNTASKQAAECAGKMMKKILPYMNIYPNTEE